MKGLSPPKFNLAKRRYKAVKKHKTTTLVALVFAFVCFIAINFISNKLFFRIDATEENLYTLSDGTKNIIKEIDELTTIKFFFLKLIRIFLKSIDSMQKE